MTANTYYEIVLGRERLHESSGRTIGQQFDGRRDGGAVLGMIASFQDQGDDIAIAVR